MAAGLGCAGLPPALVRHYCRCGAEGAGCHSGWPARSGPGRLGWHRAALARGAAGRLMGPGPWRHDGGEGSSALVAESASPCLHERQRVSASLHGNRCDKKKNSSSDCSSLRVVGNGATGISESTSPNLNKDLDPWHVPNADWDP